MANSPALNSNIGCNTLYCMSYKSNICLVVMYKNVSAAISNLLEIFNVINYSSRNQYPTGTLDFYPPPNSVHKAIRIHLVISFEKIPEETCGSNFQQYLFKQQGKAIMIMVQCSKCGRAANTSGLTHWYNKSDILANIPPYRPISIYSDSQYTRAFYKAS